MSAYVDLDELSTRSRALMQPCLRIVFLDAAGIRQTAALSTSEPGMGGRLADPGTAARLISLCSEFYSILGYELLSLESVSSINWEVE